MQNIKHKRLCLLIFIMLIFFVSIFNIFFDNLPEEIKIIAGKEQKFEFAAPSILQLFCAEPFFINGNYVKDQLLINLEEPLILKSIDIGTYDLEYRLLGFIPLKKLKVHVLPEQSVIPGGHSLGIKLRPNGVIVVGLAAVTDENGKKHYPAQDAGLRVGDTIFKINNQKIFNVEDLSEIISKKKEVILSIKRNNEILNVKIKPIKNNFGIYQIGLWVRDVTAGVGTLTFYDPNSGLYGALGHVITDADTGKFIEVGEGEIIRAKVSSISPGRKNQPGEKRGVFIDEDKIMGNIIANTPFGIFGKAYEPFHNPFYEKLPVATINQVQEGKATMLTVVEGEKIQEFEIEIQKVKRQSVPNGKGIILKVTDPELIEKTGGIIQGMSGSPIIQNGYIVGAVTHVFVNDPTKGYGIFLEWMLNEVNNIKNSKQI